VDDRHPWHASRRPSALLVTTGHDGEAIVVRQLLSSYGIPCQMVPDVTQALPIPVRRGEIRIFVPLSRLVEARRLLAEHRRQGLRVLRGGRAGARGFRGKRAAAQDGG
jgi:hypothetical protein